MSKSPKTFRVARSCFGAWERDDGRNELWENISKAYPPDANGVSMVPAVINLDNVTLDSENGSVFVLKPEYPEIGRFIFHKRES